MLKHIQEEDFEKLQSDVRQLQETVFLLAKQFENLVETLKSSEVGVFRSGYASMAELKAQVTDLRLRKLRINMTKRSED